MSAFNEFGAIERIALRHPRDAFVSREAVARQWRELNYHAEPNYDRAVAQYDRFIEILESSGAAVELLPANPGLTLDALYVRDATLVSPQGLIACAMGKPARAEEPALAGSIFKTLGLPELGAISGEGRLEGGDFLWLDNQTCVVGEGYRTNAAGIEQLKSLLGPSVEVIVVALPHYKGPADVFHLMSFLSPLDRDLALVYSPLMPVPFRDWLLSREIKLVEVPDEEFATMACNVLALAPRSCLMLEGNPITRTRLKAAGCAVTLYEGSEISAKGEGGPTCLTRPLVRN